MYSSLAIDGLRKRGERQLASFLGCSLIERYSFYDYQLLVEVTLHTGKKEN
jgi:hypothetical protein